MATMDELAPRPAQEAAWRELPEAQTKASGMELYTLLTSDTDQAYGGTPVAQIPQAASWLKQHPDATAEDFYRYLEPVANVGTLRKAGRFVFGELFEPSRVVLQAPEDEIKRLRGENESLRKQLADANAEKRALMNQARWREDEVETRRKPSRRQLAATE